MIPTTKTFQEAFSKRAIISELTNAIEYHFNYDRGEPLSIAQDIFIKLNDSGLQEIVNIMWEHIYGYNDYDGISEDEADNRQCISWHNTIIVLNKRGFLIMPKTTKKAPAMKSTKKIAMEPTSTYRPLPGDRITSMHHQAGTICGEYEVYGTVHHVKNQSAYINWDNGQTTEESLTDQGLSPVFHDPYSDTSY